ncbi:TonB-dependent receptor [Novosphingobium sp. KCTC 2891]|uniref:TonB-dependent receptor n=1 Tax=Novosphingobium sp. KCTC 2891 TaxID=2989730 RepID=UPI0022233ABF|nr:TonB-dependent receptor [Novosphingobium sp. KCTC 2891]MCW1381851.1 TonB-dependent receptor [Novosphingobium sp. KCTC 2891]
MRSLLRSTALAGLLLSPAMLPTAAFAADAPPPAPTTGESPEHPDPAVPDDAGHTPIIVSGRLITGDRDSISAPVVMTGDQLARNAQPQIGAMLAKLPGVSTSGFAPGASRPVLRGFDGPRVQVLTDGIGSLDASSVSSDHGVALDTLNVDHIDVLHGPAVLLYASDPAGGAVNAIDRRIPRAMPDKPVSVTALGSYGTAADAVNVGGAVDVALAPRLAAHFDASYNHANDLRVGGNVLSPELRASTLVAAADLADTGDLAGAADLTTQVNARGRLSNSWAHGYTVGGGLAFIDAGGSLGISVERLASDYGIPPRPAVGNPDPVSISLRQTRYDLRGSVNLTGFLDRLDLRAAYGDYTHAEIHGGVPATQFFNKAIESRLDLVQAKHGAWRGQSGVQFSTRDLTVVGDERLIPDSTTDRFAAFTRQQVSLGPVDLEGSARYENTKIATKDGLHRGYDQYSAGLGLAWHPVESVTVSLSATHGERAPSAEELFIDGIHDATQSYERGNPNFRKERSDSVEGGVRFHGDRFAGSVTAYATRFKDYIAPLPTGDAIEGYPVYQFVQVPANFRGIEAEASVKALEWGDGNSVSLDGGLDYVHAQLKNIGPAPRIPPMRLRGGIEFDSDRFGARGEVIRNAAQNRVAANENRVDGFTLVNASLTWRPQGKDGPLSLILSGDNLLDVTGRLATSETRDFVPVAGRDVRLTVSLKI